MKKFLMLLIPFTLVAIPNAPSDLQLKALSSHSVLIKWKDNAIDETSYKIYRNDKLIKKLPPDTTHYINNNLKPSTTYKYTVKSTDGKRDLLLAHGYNADKSSWDTFVSYIHSHEKDRKIYRFSVDKDGSIKKRATELAKKLNRYQIEDDSLIAIGHSMGGLDLRYIVAMGHLHQNDKNNIFYKAAKKIHKIYTIATPHKGTGLIGIDDATKDMEDGNMRKFNQKYPYSLYTIDGREVKFLAMRFKCGEAVISDGNHPADEDGSDGVVMVKKQIFNGAPYTQSIWSAKHSDLAPCVQNETAELKNVDILDKIFSQKGLYEDRKDIVFFNDNGCKGDEGGAFSSSYKSGEVNCITDSKCSNNKIASMMIYPHIKDSTIYLYDNALNHTYNDWVEINIENPKLTKPLCIESFEKPLSEELERAGVSMEYHRESRFEKGIDGKVSAIDVE